MERRRCAPSIVVAAWVLTVAASVPLTALPPVADDVFADGLESGSTCASWTQTTSADVCDGRDNDCNGVVDDGALPDQHEPNDSCAGFVTLAPVGSGGQVGYDQLTLFGPGDEDYFRVLAQESDSSCSCCDGLCTDEDYQVTFTLAVPAGAGSYRLCVGLDSCANADDFCVNVLAGTQDSVQLTLDGSCSGVDQYDLYVHVSGDNPPGSSCQPYSLGYAFTPGCF